MQRSPSLEVCEIGGSRLVRTMAVYQVTALHVKWPWVSCIPGTGSTGDELPGKGQRGRAQPGLSSHRGAPVAREHYRHVQKLCGLIPSATSNSQPS